MGQQKGWRMVLINYFPDSLPTLFSYGRKKKTSIPYEGFPKGREVHLNLSDMEMLKRKVVDVDYISPQNARGSFTGTPGESISRNGKSATYSLTGDYAVGNKISEKKLIFGRYINDADVSGNKNVVVIGEEIYKNLFDSKKKKTR